MKKKTVITTEKREVWVIREAIPEPDPPIEARDVPESPPDGDRQIPEETLKEDVT